ncbi:MAG: pilin [Patescibacteria group bacterium]
MKKILLLFLLTFFFTIPFVSFAGGDYGLTKTIAKGNLPLVFNEDKSDIVASVGGVVGIILSFVGLLFLILIVYSGIMWMTASGNDQQIDKSKKTMIWAVIGIVCIFASFAAVQFIGEQSTKPVFVDETNSPSVDDNQSANNEQAEQLTLSEAEQIYLSQCIKNGDYVEANSWSNEWSGFSDDGNMNWGGGQFVQFSQELCLCFMGKSDGRNCKLILCEHDSEIDKLSGGSGFDCVRLYGQ